MCTKAIEEYAPYISGELCKICVWSAPCFPNLLVLFKYNSRINSMCVLEIPAPFPKPLFCCHLRHCHPNQCHIPDNKMTEGEKEKFIFQKPNHY